MSGILICYLEVKIYQEKLFNSFRLSDCGGKDNFYRKINTIGLAQANKCMHLSAIAYNLKKYFKFTRNTIQSQAGVLLSCILPLKFFLRHQISRLEHSYMPKIIYYC